MSGFLTGQFILRDNTLLLHSDDGRSFPYSRVSFLSEQYAPNNMSVSFPKPYKMEGKEIVEEGAKVLIVFPQGIENPVVVGCLNSLGGQRFTDAGFRVTEQLIENFKSYKKTSDYTIEVTHNKNGYSIVLDSSYLIKVIGDTASISIYSENNTTVTGRKNLNLLGDNVEVGGNDERQYDKTPAKKRAKRVCVNAGEVYLGTSPERIPDLKLDASTEINNPKLQPTVLAYVNVELIRTIIQIVQDATYMGNGVVCQMSIDDKLDLETKVLNKLDKMISEVVFILKDKEFTK